MHRSRLSVGPEIPLQLRNRYVDLLPGIGVWRGQLRVSHFSGDGYPGIEGFLSADVDAFADGVLMRPVVFGDRMIDDDHYLVIGAVRISEIAAADQRGANGLEVVADDKGICRGCLVRPTGIDITLHGEIPAAVARDRNGVRETHGFDSGLLA